MSRLSAYNVVTLSIALFATVFSGRSLAEPTLLVEIHNFDDCFDCSPTGTFFHFNVLILTDPLPPQIRAEWSVFGAPANVGNTFVMPNDLLPAFNTVLTHPNDIFGSLGLFGNASHIFDSPPKLNFTTTNQDFITVTRVAPNLGPNLAGYRVTNITQTIDQLQYSNITPSRFRGMGAHTVRVYGEVIPEPTSVLYMTIVFLLYFCLRVSVSRCKLSPSAGGSFPGEYLQSWSPARRNLDRSVKWVM
jgi:hypothetical protein